MTDTNGMIFDGYDVYPSYLYCGWLIDPPGDGVITLTVTYLDTDSYDDYVRIYDGIDDNAPQLASMSGRSLPSSNTFTSTGGALFVKFTSDSYDDGSTGFIAEYTVHTKTSNLQCD